MISVEMSTQMQFVVAARKCLRTGKKSLSVPQSLDLASQVCAVDLGLKPALLYDSSGASAEQLQEFLSSLQSLQLVSKSLLTLDLNGNSLIINPATVRPNLERVLHNGGVVVIDVFHSLEKPAVTDLQRSELRKAAQVLLHLLEEFLPGEEAKKPLYVREKCEEWNLCSVFGLLLDYPVVYWFDQTKGFENCLSMTPLMVTTVSATWQADAAGHRCDLYSFSVPAALYEETRCDLENWKLHLQERFEQQHVLKDFSLKQFTVTLPSVCL